MLFNSYEFIFLFLPIVFFGYFYLTHHKLVGASQVWLILASLFFYGWWNIAYLPLLLSSVIVNYLISMKMLQMNQAKWLYLTKRQLMLLGVIWNILFLSYFKYMDFFVSNIENLVGIEFHFVHVALPLAISFFTIQQIAYLVDTYEGIVKEKGFLNYILFVTFFPQLIVGPIVHHKEMMPQFLRLKNKLIQYDNIAMGLSIFFIGLFKKVVLADTFAVWADRGYANAEALTFLEAWATSFSYTLQLYFDFSGYSDMAIGAALLFNIKLPINFNSPLKAVNIVDFWQRWHITLTGFITTYIYTASIRSLKKITFEKMMVMTIFSMVIVGLWHGASWTWLLFGLAHGIVIVIYYWKKLRLTMPKILGWALTFAFVNVSFVFVKVDNSNTLEASLDVLYGMLGMNGFVVPSFLLSLLPWLQSLGVVFGGVAVNVGGGLDTFGWVTFGLVLALFFKNSNELVDSLKCTRTTLWLASAVVFYSMLSIERYSTFLYFNF